MKKARVSHATHQRLRRSRAFRHSCSLWRTCAADSVGHAGHVGILRVPWGHLRRDFSLPQVSAVEPSEVPRGRVTGHCASTSAFREQGSNCVRFIDILADSVHDETRHAVHAWLVCTGTAQRALSDCPLMDLTTRPASVRNSALCSLVPYNEIQS